ncbi:L-threonylcarbamoyladenylate synthase [Alcanivorax sp. REN37]|uniref:Threonylcarbamoyl-AMP synthase n=1 Tax=Isoalcanivorax beigongshangi TaxID=3238810 RepID=A0ABV4ACN6_9GAMM
MSRLRVATLPSVARWVRDGGVVAYPTEAVYGLGCDPLCEAAVLRILALKQRPVEKGLILLAGSVEQLLPFIDVSTAEQARMAARWPGPVSWVVPASARVPAWVRGAHTTVAVRVSGHPLARELALAAGTPLVSTSANLAGQPSLRDADSVLQQLGDGLDAVLGGECDSTAKPSTIVDLHTGAVLRS